MPKIQRNTLLSTNQYLYTVTYEYTCTFVQHFTLNQKQSVMKNYFEGKANYSNGIYNLSPLQAHRLCQEGAILVDVREEYLNRFKIFDVPELMFCPMKKLADQISDLPVDRPMIFADASGIHSPEAAKMLIEKGFKGIFANLSGGLVDWEHSGLPVVVDYTEKLTGQCACQLKARGKK